MVRGSMAVAANSSVWECRRGRKSGPLAISARGKYSWIAWAAAACRPIVRRLSPFSRKRKPGLFTFLPKVFDEQ
jgi:hypothetical protein